MAGKEHTLNEIAQVVSQSLDLNDILTSALDTVLKATGVHTGGIYLLDDEHNDLVIAVYQGFNAAFISSIDHLNIGEGFSGKVFLSGKPLVVRDISQDPRLSRLAVAEEGLKSLVVIPLTSKGKTFGTLFLVSDQVRDYQEDEIKLLISAGRQIAVAIDHASMFRAAQRRAEQFQVISEVGRQITSIMDIDQVLEKVVRLIQQTFNCDHVGIATIEDDYAVYRVGAGPLWDNPDYQFKPSKLKIGREGITGYVARLGEAIYAPDVREDPRFLDMENSGTLSELTVPIKAKGNIIGVLDAQSKRLNAFDQSDIMVMQSLADQAAIAMENARLYQQAKRFAVLEERNRIARELHDSVTQALYGITLHTEAAFRHLQNQQFDLTQEQLEDLRGTAQEALREMRLLIFELRPSVLQNQGLVSALKARIEAVEERAGLEVSFTAEGDVNPPSHVQDGLYRIAQEALNNALKHARAKRIDLHLHAGEETLTLAINDDGIGFDPETAIPGGGLGLDGMIERADEMGAVLTLDSRPGEGTVVKIEVPHEWKNHQNITR